MERIKLQMTCADIPMAIDRLTARGITIYDFETADDITAVCFIDASFCDQIMDLGRYGCKIEILRDVRISFAHLLIRRWVLIASICFLLILTVMLPTKVLFFRVEGNVTLPDRLILEQAESCGIYFGADRRDVRSERVKNQLLQLIPQLQWAGINTSGCVAVISVRERQQEKVEESFDGIGNMVSARDGIIQSVTVLQGNGQCKPGQAVRKGEVLISGYTDCGNMIRAEAPRGEVFALTNRSFTAIFPRCIEKKGSIIRQEKKYALLIGKKRINLYKDSGILDGSCDKMYSYSYVMLPGGFQLPLALIREQWTVWKSEPDLQSAEDTEALLHRFAANYLQSQMVAGKIIHSDQKIEIQEDRIILTGSYACSEMIGQILYEERFQSNGENN